MSVRRPSAVFDSIVAAIEATEISEDSTYASRRREHNGFRHFKGGESDLTKERGFILRPTTGPARINERSFCRMRGMAFDLIVAYGGPIANVYRRVLDDCEVLETTLLGLYGNNGVEGVWTSETPEVEEDPDRSQVRLIFPFKLHYSTGVAA